MAIDGQLDDWAGIIFHDIPAPRDADKRGASFATAYTKDSILIALNVRDPDPGLVKDQNPQQHAQFLYHDFAGSVFKENAVEVRLDARPDPDRSRNTGWRWFTEHLFLGIYPGSAAESPIPMLPEKLPVGTTQAVAHEPGSYSVELSIPINYIRLLQGVDWKAYRLNVVIHDKTAAGDFIRYSWQPDWRSPDNAFGSGTFFRE